MPPNSGMLRKSLAALLGAALVLQEPAAAFAQVKLELPPESLPDLPSVGPETPAAPTAAIPALASEIVGTPNLSSPEALPLPQTPLTSERFEGRARSISEAGLLKDRGAVQNATAGQARGLGEDLQRRLEGMAKGGGVSVPEADERPLGSAEEKADSSGYHRARIKSFWWYGTDRVIKYWEEYRSSAEKNAEPAVRSPRSFIAALRVMGTDGDFAPLGFKTASWDEVEADAYRIYDKFVDAGPDARAAFARLVERAKTFNPNKRETNFRKLLRHALMEAATTPRSKLAAAYDSELTIYKRIEVEAFQAQEMGRRYEAFKRAVRDALAEEAPGPGRPIAVVLLGSYVNRAATPSSDFDFEVVTSDGRYARVPAFAERLEKLWIERGETAEVSAISYALPPSAALLSRIHREPYEVLAADPAVETALASRPAGPDQRPFWGPILKALHWVMAQTTMVVYDLRNGPAGARAPPGAGRAFWATLASRTLSISAFVVTLIAFPLLAKMTPGVSYAELMAFSTVVVIAANPLAGRLVDRAGLRNLIAFNNALRISLYAASAAVVAFHWNNFATLLVLAALNGVNTAFTMNFENALVTHFWGNDVKVGSKVNATFQFDYLGLQVFLGTFLSAGLTVDRWGFIPTYALASGLVVAALLLGLAIPNVRVESRRDPSQPGGGWKETAQRNALGAAVFSATIAGYLLLHSTLLPILGLMFWITRTESFRFILKDPKLRMTMAFMALVGILFFPIQAVVVPAAAGILAPGAVGATQGHLLGALFFGQLLAATHPMQLHPKVKAAALTVLSGLVGLWSWLQLFPGSLPAAAAAVAASGLLSYVLSRFTNKAWIQFMGAGLAFVWLPYLHWSAATMLLSLSMIGLFYSPVWVHLISSFQNRIDQTAPDRRGALLGVQGAAFNASIALGYALAGLDLAKFGLPTALLPIGIVFTAAAALLALAPRWLHGLAERLVSRLGYAHKAQEAGVEGPGTSRTSGPRPGGPFKG